MSKIEQSDMPLHKRVFSCISCFEIPYIEFIMEENSLFSVVKCKCGTKKIPFQKLNSYYGNPITNNINCSVCNATITEIEVLHCSICKVYLCSTCRLQHNNNHLISIKRLLPNSFCPTHKTEELNEYCYDCNKPTCSRCKCENHLKHTTKPFTELLSDKKYESIALETLSHFKKNQEYNSEMKRQIVEYLERYISEVNEGFYHNNKINYQLFQYVKMILFNYYLFKHTPNYQVISNVIQNTKMNYSKFDSFYYFNLLESKNKLLKYFKSNLFIKVNNGNIIFENMELIKELGYHSDKVTCIIQLNDGRLASCSKDQTIKIYSSDNYELETSIQEDEGNQIQSIAEINNGIILSNTGKKLKLWKIDTKKPYCMFSIKPHLQDISKMLKLKSNNISTCSQDGTIKIWNFNVLPNEPLAILGKNSPSVEFENENFVIMSKFISITELDDGRIVSADSYKEIAFWNLLSCRKEHSIQNIDCCSPNNLAHFKNKILFVGGKKNITLVRIDTYQIDSVICFNPIFELHFIIPLDNNSVLCGRDSSYINQIQIHKLKAKLINCYSDSYPIYYFCQLDNGRIACSANKKIIIYK